jgi:hypothetical protein
MRGMTGLYHRKHNRIEPDGVLARHSYKFDYSEEFAFVFVLRSNEKSAPVFAGWLRTRGVRIHSFRDLIKAKTRPSSARMEFWRGTNMLISNRH